LESKGERAILESAVDGEGKDVEAASTTRG